MKNIFPFLSFCLLISISISSSSCAEMKMNKLLKTHQNALNKAAMNNVSPEEKFDVLATSFTRVLDEAISFTNPKRSVKYVQEYAKQNQKSIDLIANVSGERINKMSDTEKIIFAAGLARKPYTKNLIANIPKFERKVGNKIKAIQFLGKLSDLFTLEKLLGM